MNDIIDICYIIDIYDIKDKTEDSAALQHICTKLFIYNQKRSGTDKV